MAKVSEKKKRDALAEYARVVDAAELINVALVNLSFNVSPQYFERTEDAELGYEIQVVEHSYSVEHSSVVAVVECEVYAKLDSEPAVRCEASYVVSYMIGEVCDEDAVAVFVKRVGVFACYPYFRAVVANLDWAAGTQLPPMPVHREKSVSGSDKVEKQETHVPSVASSTPKS